MKYKSELIKEIVDTRGHKKSSLHYESECVEKWIEETKGAYPKLCDYESEWLNYISILDDKGGSEDPEPPIGEFPYVVLSDVTEATIDNVVPYAYKSAILSGQTLDSIVDFKDSFSVNNNVIDFDFLFKNKIDLTYTLVINITEATSRLGASDYIEVRGIREDNTFVSIKRLTQEFAVGTYSIDFTFNEVFSRLRLAVSFNCVANAKLKGELYSVKVPVLTTSNEDGTKTNILSTSEDVTLRGIGDVRDELDLLTGEVTERIGEIMLSNNNNVALYGVDSDTHMSFKINGLNWSFVHQKLICDKLPYSSNVVSGNNEGIYCLANSNIYVRIAKNKLTSYDANGFKEWWNNNPLTIQYELATESIKTVDLNIQEQNGKTLSVIKPIDGTMNLSTSSDTIKPLFSGEIPVEAITQNLASFIDLD